MPDRYANGSTANDRGGLSGPRTKTGFDPTDPAYYHGGDLAGLTAEPAADQGSRLHRALGDARAEAGPGRERQRRATTATGGSTSRPSTRISAATRTSPTLVAKAHGLGLKVYLDVVVNHTADIVQLTGTSYTDAPYRDCHGKAFNPREVRHPALPVPEGVDDAARAVRAARRPRT